MSVSMHDVCVQEGVSEGAGQDLLRPAGGHGNKDGGEQWERAAPKEGRTGLQSPAVGKAQDSTAVGPQRVGGARSAGNAPLGSEWGWVGGKIRAGSLWVCSGERLGRSTRL